MATSKLIFSNLRRHRHLHTISHLLLSTKNPHNNLLPSHPPILSLSPLHNSLASAFHFSTGSKSAFFINSATESAPDSQFINPGFNDLACEDLILPVRALISLLDAYHNLTGLPWWIIIASSTVVMRVTIFPLLVFQLHKLKMISELFPKLPPPFPQSLSGKSYTEQFSHFQNERRALGCPSFLWFFAYFSVQAPCFFLWVTSVRRMSLDHHPGFDSGGTLWFQNLTEYPHGVLGRIFPLLIAGLHYLNIQLSFERSSIQKMTGLLGLLARGSLVYWVTNSSISAIQQLSLKHPTVRAKLGLPDKDSSTTDAYTEEVVVPGIASSDSPANKHKVPAENLSAQQLVAISVQLLSNGDKERAIPLLKMALEKDPDHVNSLIVMGQTLLQKELYAEAVKYLELAISKLHLAEDPTEAKDVDILILVSQWAGIACIQQGKNLEGIVHLERIINLKEPEDPNSKVHYFNSLIFLASVLLNEDRRAEAIKYLRLVVAYNPAYSELLEQRENDEDKFFNDLVSSRRSDY